MYQKVIVLGSTQLAVKSAALAASKAGAVSVEYLDTSRITKSEAMEILCSQQEKTLVLSIMNPYIITPQAVRHPALTILNAHHALLPGHRGRNAQAWALFCGEKETGITWHFVDEGIDTGKLIRTVIIPIQETDTSLTLLKKQNDAILVSLEAQLPGFLAGKFGSELPAERTEFFHLNSEIPNGGELDLSWTGDEMHRFLRTMDFGALRIFGKPYLIYNDRKYIIKKYSIHQTEQTERKIDFRNDAMEILKDGYTFHLLLL